MSKMTFLTLFFILFCPFTQAQENSKESFTDTMQEISNTFGQFAGTIGENFGEPSEPIKEKVNTAFSSLNDLLFKGISTLYFSAFKNKTLPLLTDTDKKNLPSLLPEAFRTRAKVTEEKTFASVRLDAVDEEKSIYIRIERNLGINLMIKDSFETARAFFPAEGVNEKIMVTSPSNKKYDTKNFRFEKSGDFTIGSAEKDNATFLLTSARPFLSIQIEVFGDENAKKAREILSQLNAAQLKEGFKVADQSVSLKEMLEEKKKAEASPEYYDKAMTYLNDSQKTAE